MATELLTLPLLAKLLQRAEGTIRNDLCRKPDAVPVPFKLPGTRHLLWKLEDVEAWLTRHAEQAKAQAAAAKPSANAPKRRGRPRKSV